MADKVNVLVRTRVTGGGVPIDAGYCVHAVSVHDFTHHSQR
jgi:hypothetical protein